LNITIVPPFLRSRFAIGFYILFILLVFLYLLKLTVDKERMRLAVQHENEVRELRTRFFMNISHELRTPLTLIAVPLKQIVQDFQSKQKTPNLRELSMIYRNVTRIMHIIDQIFDFRRIELNKMEMKVDKICANCRHYGFKSGNPDGEFGTWAFCGYWRKWFQNARGWRPQIAAKINAYRKAQGLEPAVFKKPGERTCSHWK